MRKVYTNKGNSERWLVLATGELFYEERDIEQRCFWRIVPDIDANLRQKFFKGLSQNFLIERAYEFGSRAEGEASL